MNEHEAKIPGLDLQRLAPWMRDNVPDAASAGERLSARLIAGGKSNLTYELSSGARTWVLRRPPLGHVLSTAHDMVREYTALSALAPTSVPVPQVYALCREESVIGAPFYVMERMDGAVFRRADELAALGPARTRAISEQLVDVLASLHAVEPSEVGLSDYGRPEGFLSRQLRRWRKQLEASHSRDLPGAQELHSRLSAHVEAVDRAGAAPGIVHGDYRLDNTLIASGPLGAPGEDHITAVVDWEMSTLGDPLADVALMLVYGRCSELPLRSVLGDAVAAPGFLSEPELISRYEAVSARDLGRLHFHLGLAFYKLATIAEGIYYRHSLGQTVGAGFEGVGDSVELLFEAGLGALE